MKLYDYLKLMPSHEELTVWDTVYDFETYFYGNNTDGKWDKCLLELSKLLTIKEIRRNGVIVNLTEVIEKNLPNLEKTDLFIDCDIESIMLDMDNILSGAVSEKWLEKFVENLKEC